jgi:NAD(P)H-nitrite reductase large subunit
MVERHVIIGNGAAGIAAAEQIRSLDPQCDLTIISMDQDGYYSRPGLAYLLNGELPEKQLFPLERREIATLKLNLVFDEVCEIEPLKKTVRLRNAGSRPYDRLLLAMGAQAVAPKFEGVDLEGVVKLDTLHDARRILKLARKTRQAVVIGGGITALELAEGLAARGVETHYLLRRERFWPGVLDEAESALVESRLEHEGIRLHREVAIKRILGRRGRVWAVETEEGLEIRCQMVAVAIGIRPRIDLARQAGLATERGVLVDERLRTSAEAVFAAGDVAQVYDSRLGTYVLDSLWWPAAEQGRTAGANMAGERRIYQKPIAMNVTRIGGLTTTIIGSLGGGEDDLDLLSITRGDSEAWRRAPDSFAVRKDQEANRVRLMLSEKTIIGALVMGDQRLSRPLQDLVLHAVNIKPIRDRLLQANGSFEEAIFSFWNEWKGSGDAIQS